MMLSAAVITIVVRTFVVSMKFTACDANVLELYGDGNNEDMNVNSMDSMGQAHAFGEGIKNENLGQPNIISDLLSNIILTKKQNNNLIEMYKNIRRPMNIEVTISNNEIKPQIQRNDENKLTERIDNEAAEKKTGRKTDFTLDGNYMGTKYYGNIYLKDKKRSAGIREYGSKSHEKYNINEMSHLIASLLQQNIITKNPEQNHEENDKVELYFPDKVVKRMLNDYYYTRKPDNSLGDIASQLADIVPRASAEDHAIFESFPFPENERSRDSGREEFSELPPAKRVFTAWLRLRLFSTLARDLSVPTRTFRQNPYPVVVLRNKAYGTMTHSTTTRPVGAPLRFG